jgi:4-aminobutyrate aminotransferase
MVRKKPVGTPNSKTDAMYEIDEELIANSMKVRFFPMVVSEGKGVTVKDADGKEYIDFSGGSACVPAGYNHPEIVEAIVAQAKKLAHNCLPLYSYDNAISLAQKMIEITPGSFDKKVWFGCSGSDASECIYKMSRCFTKRKNVISFIGGFYGVSTAASSMTGHPALSKFASLPGIVKVPYPYCYRCPFGKEYPECNLQCLEYVDYILSTLSPPEDTALMFIEPIQGDAGMIVPPDEFLPGLYKVCKEHGIVFAVDEVRTGFGRTGKMFATEYAGIAPDAINTGKPTASGLPLSTCVARREILDCPGGFHVLTTAGTTIPCAASLATIQVIQKEKLCDNAKRVGGYLKQRLEELKEKHEIIGDVRGRGLFIGAELVKDRKTKKPASLETHKLCYRAWQKGLLCIFLGIYSNVLDIMPPLIITKEQVDKAIDIIDSSLTDVEKGRVPNEAVSRFAAW